MNDYIKIKYKYFFLSFSVSFLVLSLMFLFMMSMAHPKVPESLIREPDIDESATAYIPTESDSLSVLFMGVGNGESAAGTYILAKFDPERGKVPIVAFPPQTAVQNADKVESLAEVYRYGGAQYTRDALAETIGIEIDRYVRIRADDFIAGAAAIGTVEFDLEEKVTVTRGGAPVTLEQGRQLLDGQKVSDIIRYEDYPDGELQRCRIASELAADIVNQRMDICRSTVFDNVFEKLINLISTDISYQDYYNRKHAANFLAKLGNNPADPIPVSGQWNADRTLYTLSDTFIALLTQTLK